MILYMLLCILAMEGDMLWLFPIKFLLKVLTKPYVIDTKHGCFLYSMKTVCTNYMPKSCIINARVL